MSKDDELQQLMNSVADKSLHIIEQIQGDPEYIPDIIRQYIQLIEDMQSLTMTFLSHPEKLMQSQFSYWQDAFSLFQNQCLGWLDGKSSSLTDKRFKHEGWQNNPFFNCLGQHYLLASEHFNALLEQVQPDDPKVARKIRFLAQQYLDALSPANYLYTNPQLLSETIQSHGTNLLKGLNNFLSDVESGSHRLIIKMTDMNAFEPGKNIACTPGKVIFRNDLMELIQYEPVTEKVKSVPLLIVPPWINKYYILDLSPENSLVKWLTEQGITVFIISWVNPDERHADKSFFDYLHEGPETAIEIIQKQMKVEQVNTLGFCIGGTLLASLLAYHQAIGKKLIKSATFLAAMIDFSDPGDISVYIDDQQIKQIEVEMKRKGYLAGDFLASTFNSLRANDLIWSFFIKNYLQGKDPVPFDLLFWNADSTNMPARMMSEYLRWMYLHNDLIKPNQLKIKNAPLNIHKVNIPVCFVSTIKDHIAPWQTVYKGFQAFSGPKKFILGGSGHIAGIVNPPSANKYFYYSAENEASDSDLWLTQAEQHSGSWWPTWMDWLKKRSGKMIPAPSIENLTYKGLIKAPGRYVKI